MSAVVVEAEPCAWLVGPDRWARPCHKPSVSLARRGPLAAWVCPKCRSRALARGWEAEP